MYCFAPHWDFDDLTPKQQAPRPRTAFKRAPCKHAKRLSLAAQNIRPAQASPSCRASQVPPPRIFRPQPKMQNAMQNTLQTSARAINAVVTSAGLMQKTVKVRIGTQKWNKKVRKVRITFLVPSQLPFSSLSGLSFSSRRKFRLCGCRRTGTGRMNTMGEQEEASFFGRLTNARRAVFQPPHHSPRA